VTRRQATKVQKWRAEVNCSRCEQRQQSALYKNPRFTYLCRIHTADATQLSSWVASAVRIGLYLFTYLQLLVWLAEMREWGGQVVRRRIQAVRFTVQWHVERTPARRSQHLAGREWTVLERSATSRMPLLLVHLRANAQGSETVSWNNVSLRPAVQHLLCRYFTIHHYTHVYTLYALHAHVFLW